MAKIVRSAVVAISAALSGVRMRCPACRANGNFEPVLAHDAGAQTGEILGLRKCPNPNCSALVFFVRDKAGTLQSFPAERIDFDTKDIPQGVHDAFEEAITCHAEQCFVAAAI